MSKPLKEYVQQVLAEQSRGEFVRQSLEYANGMVKTLAASATWRRKGTRRALFWEFAVDKFIELSQADPGLRVIEHYDTVSFLFEDAVLLRFKKADLTLRTSNYPTPTAELFHDFSADLFGFEGLQRVEAVYIPNRFDTGIVWSGIVAHDGNSEIWNFELCEPMDTPVATLPAVIQTPAADLAKLKNQAKDAGKKKGDSGAA